MLTFARMALTHDTDTAPQAKVAVATSTSPRSQGRCAAALRSASSHPPGTLPGACRSSPRNIKLSLRASSTRLHLKPTCSVDDSGSRAGGAAR